MGLFGPLCNIIWGLSKYDAAWVEEAMIWVYPFWWVMFYAEGTRSNAYGIMLLIISLSANMLFFIVLAFLLIWLYELYTKSRLRRYM